MKKWETTFNNNHLRLMQVHIGFVVFYIILAILYVFFAYSFGAHVTFEKLILTCMLFFSPFILLHWLLAVGAKNKVEISLKVSEIVFAFLLLVFPIGTILSMLYFLPKTTWKLQDNNTTV